MKKVVKEYEVYSFDELDEDIQEKLIEKEQEEQKEFYLEWYLYEDMVEESKRLLDKYFNYENEFKNVYYDLSYCQGSGAMIEFSINIVDLNKKYKFLSDEELRFIQDKGIINEIEIYHSDSYYYHEYTFSIKYDDNFGYWDYEDIKDDYKIAEEDFNKLEDKIIDFLDTYNKLNKENSQFIEDIIAMNKELYRIGYELIEEPSYEEFCKEQLREHEYLKSGEIF